VFGRSEVVRLLLERGLDPNESYGTGNLHRALQSKDVETVRLLLDAGADVHREDRSGGTPLAAAKKAGLAVIVTMIEASMTG
jgi:ankyrin repeat protein